jgi:TolB protein
VTHLSQRRIRVIQRRHTGLPSRQTRLRRAILPLLVFAFLVQCAPRQTSQEEQARRGLGGKLAFAANVKGNWDLFVMNGDGTGLTQLTDTALDERQPALSPDGQQVAYSTSDGVLWIMPLATKVSEAVPLSPGRYGYPAWLQDGSGLVFTSYKFTPGNEDADLFVFMFAERKERALLTQTGPQDYPAPAPANAALAYVSSLATVMPGFGNTLTQQLWIAPLRSGKPTQLLVGSVGETRPAWSPDGKWIAFSSARQGSPDIWLVKLDGQELAQLTNASSAETSPTWSPDGREIVYVSTESDRMQLRLLNVDTHASRSLTPFGADAVEVNDPCWR